MATVEELVVKATPEGVSEVTDQMGDMTESVEASKEEMEDTADGFGDLQNRFQGAGAAIAGAFAATTGAFIGRVPVLAESMDAFGALFDTLGLKVDSLLRGPLTRVNNFIFGLSDTVSQAEGPIGKLVGFFSLIATMAVGAVAGFASLKIATLGFVGGLKATGAALLTVGKFIGGLIASIISIKAALVLAVAAVIAFIAAYITNFKGTRDKTDEIMGNIKDFIVNGFKKLKKKAGKKIATFVKLVKDKFGAMKGDIGEVFDNLVAGAKEWGKNMIRQIINGITSKAGDLKSAVEDVDLTAGVSIGDVTQGVSGGIDTATDSGRDFIGSVSNGSSGVYLDGRNVENTQGRYRKDNLSRRGG